MELVFACFCRVRGRNGCLLLLRWDIGLGAGLLWFGESKFGWLSGVADGRRHGLPMLGVGKDAVSVATRCQCCSRPILFLRLNSVCGY